MRRWRWVILLATSLGHWASAGEAEPEPPFVGEVTGSRVRIRAGGGTNYTILAVAEKGQRVSVRERREGWLGIAVPEGCTVWVSKALLTLDADGKAGTAAKDRVNVRARANPTADVVGQLPQGARVKVTDDDGEWCGIVAPPQVSAWIDARYVRKAEGAVPEPAVAQTQEGPPKEGAPKKTVEFSAAAALLRKAQERYASELAKPPKDRDFGEVLTIYQKVVTDCQDEAVARQAEAARQRLLKIVDIHQALQAAREPFEQFEKKHNALEADYKRKAAAADAPTPK